MNMAIRPYVTGASAIVGASVLVVAPITVPAHDAPDSAGGTVAVAPASLVTDVLDAYGVIVNAATRAVDIGVAAALGLPFEVALVTGAGIETPAAVPNLGSFLLYRYFSENVIAGTTVTIGAFVFEFLEGVLLPPAGLLPPPLGPSPTDPGLILSPVAALTGLISDILAGLPDPIPGVDAYWNFVVNNLVGRLLFASNLGVRAPISAVTGVVSWLGEEPAQVAKAVEGALANPLNIPGLLSGLVHNVVDLTTSSLLAKVVNPFYNAGEFLPPPLDGLVLQARLGLSGLITGVLTSVLPAPIFPLTLPSAAVSHTPVTTAEPSAAVEDASTPSSADRPDRALGVSADEPAVTDSGAEAAVPMPAETRSRAPAEPATTATAAPSESGAVDSADTAEPDKQRRKSRAKAADDAVDSVPTTARKHRPGSRPDPATGDKSEPREVATGESASGQVSGAGASPAGREGRSAQAAGRIY